MSIAERTRMAARSQPFLVEALRAGVVNYTAAARFLDVGDTDAVAAALRRFATEVAERPPTSGEVRLRMVTGLGRSSDGDASVIVVGDNGFELEAGELTAIVAEGTVPSAAVGLVHWQLAERGTTVHASAWDTAQFIVVTDRASGPDGLRIIEETLTANSRD